MSALILSPGPPRYRMNPDDDAERAEQAERAEAIAAPYGRCLCGDPAAHSSPAHECNGCRTDGWYDCEDCGETYRKQGLGALGYVVVVGAGGRNVYLDHDCARRRFLRAAGKNHCTE